jgi:hypothetical protein
VYAGVQEFAAAGSLAAANGPKAQRVFGGFFALLGLVSLMVLLIACANVAGLLIARGTRRRQEIAIRLAIGGTRSRLVQQFLVEGFWLALIGTAAGMALSAVFMKLVNSLSLPVPIPIELHLGIDPAMFVAAVVLIFVTILLCGVMPALSATRLALVPALKREEPFYANRRLTARGVLLTGQVMVSTVLLVTALLFLRNLARMQVTDPGFEVDRALVGQLGFVRGQPGADHIGVLQRAVERVSALPGVEEAAFSSAVPLTMYGGSTSGLSARIDGGESKHVEFARSFVGPRYFSMGIRRWAGASFRRQTCPERRRSRSSTRSLCDGISAAGILWEASSGSTARASDTKSSASSPTGNTRRLGRSSAPPFTSRCCSIPMGWTSRSCWRARGASHPHRSRRCAGH